MTAKHTPGPWEFWIIEDDPPGEPFIAIAGNGIIFCRIPIGKHVEPRRQEFEANARLIALAPEMALLLQNLAHATEAIVGNIKGNHRGLAYGQVVELGERAAKLVLAAGLELHHNALSFFDLKIEGQKVPRA